MTHATNCRTAGAGQEKQPALTRRKAVLTCAGCDHSSPPDGDWIFRIADNGTEIRCPNCHGLLTVR